MIFPGVDLFHHATYPRSIASHQHEEVLGNEAKPGVVVYDLDVSKSLLIGADFVLTFDDEHSPRL